MLFIEVTIPACVCDPDERDAGDPCEAPREERTASVNVDHIMVAEDGELFLSSGTFMPIIESRIEVHAAMDKAIKQAFS